MPVIGNYQRDVKENMNKNTEIESSSNAFARLLQEQRSGDCLIEASEKLQSLILKVRERLRPGEMTIKIKFDPKAKGIVTITDEVIVKMPKEDKDATLFFTTEQGMLTRKNPDQQELELRVAKGPESPLKEAEKIEQPLRTATA